MTNQQHLNKKKKQSENEIVKSLKNKHTKGKNKENKGRNANKTLTKIPSEISLNNKKSRSINKISQTKHQNFANIPTTSDPLSPKRLIGLAKSSGMNKNKSSNRLLSNKQTLMVDSRPLSPLSNNDNLNWLISQNSSEFMDQQKTLCFSPVNQSIQFARVDQNKQLVPQNQMRMIQSYYHSQGEKRQIPNNAKMMNNEKIILTQGMSMLSPTNSNCHQSQERYHQCERCEQFGNKIVRLAVQLDTLKMSNAQDPFHILEQISNTIIEFKLQRHKYDTDKLKLQQDVEKLIKNQESFEQKVKELDEVYAMLVTEKNKLHQKKSQLDQLSKTKSETLITYQKELKQIKDNLSNFKLEVRRAVEKEVKDTVYRKNRDKDYVYDYPCQITKTRTAKSQDRVKPIHNEQVPIEEIKKREQELDQRESKLYEWEASLFEKKMKIDNQNEELKGKLERMTVQKQEVSQNLKKLQILTKNYEEILQKEYEMTKMVEEIRNSKQQIADEKNELLNIKNEVVSQRECLQKEQLDAAKVDRYLAKVRERAQIEIEDNLSYIMREREKCQLRMKEAQEMKTMLEKEKQRWIKGVNQQQRKLEQLVEEKKEQVTVMEVSMRQQIKEIRAKQELLDQREKEIEERNQLIKEELENERKCIEKEKEDVKCLMLELEEKQNGRQLSASKSKKKYKKTNMPRQMPNSEKQLDQNLLGQLQPHNYSIQQAQPQTFNQQTKSSSTNMKSQVQTQKLNFDLDNFSLEDDDFQNLIVPQYAQTTMHKTPKSTRKQGIPPKAPTSILSQSTQKLYKKDRDQKERQQQQQNQQSTNVIDLSLDQDQQLEQLLMLSSQEFGKNTKTESDDDIFNQKGQFQFDQYLSSNNNDINLLNDDGEDISLI